MRFAAIDSALPVPANWSTRAGSASSRRPWSIPEMPTKVPAALPATPRGVAGKAAGTFVGISGMDHGRLLLADPARVDQFAGTGNALSIAANRIAYALDLRGPSLAVDTACSSSLVAVHLACRSLRQG